MSHDHQDAKSVFLHALELQSPARGQFLDQACQGDPHLRERVDELLRSFAEAESFLEQRAAAVFGSPAAATPQAGDTIGPYKLLEQIGEGGMGVVYMAEQTEPVQRRVALKIIKPGMDTRQVIARFEAERQALAIMDHVNIARVIDAGTTDGGRPYFVMELVHGVPITQYCDDNHLTPRQRLDLFVPVCQAIQHAHQKGIIHRDIKPSNVMVTLYDGKPVPKVIDFGVAKATEQKLTERTLFTQYGTLVGTLEYMSPEQAEMSALGVDTRSDIYSLGVLLYELLTGSTPLSSQRMKEAGYAEILRLIKEEEPPKPSTRLSESGESLASISAQRHTEPAKLSRLMRGELDWIVMKCLEKDRNRRYETANGFASDVQRYLADEPVQACPPSAAYRFRKFAKRNKRVLAMMLLVVAALVGGVMATTWQALRATQAEQRALADRDAKSRALEAERQARQEATQASVQTLEALRAMTDVTVTRQLGGQVQLTDQDRAFFTQIIARFEGLAAVRGDGAESRALRAEGNYRAGCMRYHLQEWRDALPAFERARNVYGDLAADFPADPAYRSGLAGSHKLVGEVLVQLGRSHEAEAAYRLAISQFQRLGIDFSASPESRPGIVATRGNLAGLLSNQGRLAEAEAEFRLALAAAEELQSDMPPVRSHRQLLITRHLNLGIFLWERQRKQAEGEAEIRRALALQTELAAESPDQPKYYDDLATCHHHLGRLLAAGGQPTDATAQYRAALVIENKLAADFPAVPRYRQTLAKTYLLLGIILADQEMPAEAQAQYRRALALQQPLVEDFPDVPAYADQLAKTYHRLGINLESQHLSEEAIDVYRRAQALWAELSADFPAGPDFHWNLANCRRQLGMLLAARGHLADAEAEYRAAIAIETELVAEFAAVALYHRSLASTYRLLGNVLTEEGNVADGVAEYRRALVPLKRLVDEFPGVPDYREQLTLILSRLGAALEKEGDLDNAKECYGEAIELYTTLAADLPLETRYTRKLVELLAKSGRGQEIEGVQRDAIARLEKVTVADSQMHAYRQALGQRYEEIGEWDKAAAEYTRALELRHDVEELWTRRAAAQFQLQRWKEAAADYSQAIARAPKVHTNWYHRGHAHLQLAEWEKAASDFTEIVTGWPAEPGGWYLRAISCAQLNKPEQAMADLRQAVAAGFNDLEGMKHEPRLEPLRSTKDYKELLAELEARNSSP